LRVEKDEKELREIKFELAQMDKKEFGYTYNLFSLLENNEN
jgi:hypothetical protein